MYVTGKLRTHKWTDNDQVERYSTEVLVDRQGVIRLVGPSKDKEEAAPPYDGAGDEL